MSLSKDAYNQGYQAALEKFAARRGLLEIRNAVAGGDMARANRLATTPGVLSAGNRAGSQLRDLGGGGEGLATLVAHPRHGVSVRKMYDPNAGMYSDSLIRRKEQLGSMPGAAAFYGSARTAQGTPMHFNEYVQGREVRPDMLERDRGLARNYLRSMRSVSQAGRAQGYSIQDLRGVNAIQAPGGQVKFIDYAPFKTNELEPAAYRHNLRAKGMRNVVPVSGEGVDLFSGAGDYRTAVNSRDPGAFKRFMFTGEELQRKPAPAPARPRAATPAPVGPEAATRVG